MRVGPRATAWLALVMGVAATSLVQAAPPSKLGRTIQRIVEEPPLGSGFWGIEVRRLRDGRVLYARNERKSLSPASTLKLVTTAAALDALGPEARLSTTLETSARLDRFGRILGDVFLVGRGDPNLSGRFFDGRITAPFEGLAASLADAGVRRIEGRLVGHEGLFAGDRRGEDWSWGDLVWWYGAEVSALSFNDNCVDVTVRPGARVGDSVVVEAEPASAYYTVVSSAVTGRPGVEDGLTLEPELGTNTIRLSGELPLDSRPRVLYVAVRDPARYAAAVFSEVLAARGIEVTGGAATSSDSLPPARRVLATHESPPLAELIREINKPSQNLHAEMLLRLLGAHTAGDGSVEAGLAAVDAFLTRIGVDAAGWALADGSGLSRSNLLTARGLVELLAAMDRHPHATAFRDSLAIAGQDGTLEKRLVATPAAGRIQGKTGTLGHVSALAGYATTLKGERLAFAILANHHTVEGREVLSAVDSICQALVR